MRATEAAATLVTMVAVVGSPANVTNEQLVARWRGHGIPARLMSAAEARECLGLGDCRSRPAGPS
jgi:hypothetical protein